MPEITAEQVAQWLQPILMDAVAEPNPLCQQVAIYVQVLLRWNQKMNLTAVRNPQELVQVHLSECLRCAQLLPSGIATVLDFGSGAGLPGIPIQLLRPEISVTLAESQTRKAMFLKEVVRVLGLGRATVYSGRVEALPKAQQFDAVVLRAVDRMEKALPAAAARVASGGWCAVLTTETQRAAIRQAVPHFAWQSAVLMPGSRQRVVLFGQNAV